MTHAGPKIVDIVLADGFVLTELAGVVDVLRIANRLAVRPAFEWIYRSVSGGTKEGAASALVNTQPVCDNPKAAYVVVLGNADPDHLDLAHGPRLTKYVQSGTQVILLSEAASRYIADWGDNGAGHTTHWENRVILLEQKGLHDTKSALVSKSGSTITCAGMSATIDVMLSVVGQEISLPVMMSVADIMLHEQVRNFSTMQPYCGHSIAVTGDEDVDYCIARMQDNIELPLTLAEIAEGVEVSLRSLERKFHKYLGCTPNGYYRQLRLTKANNLLLNTQMSIHEVGLACGFPSGFSGIYKQSFGKTPRDARNRGRLS